jgi:AcrR family transcriptional regulator
MGTRPTKPKSKQTRAAAPHDSLAQTRAVPAIDELAQTREGGVVSNVALLDAGELEIGLRGFARTKVEHVAERAGVSVDVFRAHFAGMGALLRALNTRFVEQMMAAVDASTASGSWRGARVRDVVEIAVRSILEVVQDRQGLVRAFLAHGTTDRALANGLRRIGAHMTDRLVVALRECSDAPAPRDRTVAFSLLLSVALAHHSILVGDDWSGVRFTRDELAEEASRVIGAYLAERVPS